MTRLQFCTQMIVTESFQLDMCEKLYFEDSEQLHFHLSWDQAGTFFCLDVGCNPDSNQVSSEIWLRVNVK